jgi:hypothetical protein
MERRHFNRVPFCTEAKITVANKQWQTDIIDLSLKGALLQIPNGAVVKTGDNIDLSFTLNGLDIPIAMQGQVRYSDDEKIGFQCTSLDIDSATELRRLIELNLSDEKLLQRDLSALIQGL